MGPVKTPELTGLERVFILELPLREKVNKRTYEAINLNIYRNQHHYKRNNQKKAFHDRMKKPLSKLPKLGKVWLHYEIFPKTRRRLDTMNPGSVIDKFFSDCLVDEKILTDDNYEYVVFNSFSVGCVDKVNPRCMVTIIELIDPKEDEMKLSMTANLSTEDVQAAIAAWVTEETGQEASAEDVTLTADGATVSVGEAPAAKAKPKIKRRTKAQMEADKAKETSDDTVAETGASSTPGDDAGTSEPTETGSTDTESEDEPTTETEGEGKESKNPSEDNPEESFNDGGEEAAEETAPKKVKKGSIFDT